EPLEKTLTANLKWLAGYRHPRNAGRPRLAAAADLTRAVVSFPSRRRTSNRRTTGPRNARTDTAGKVPLEPPPTPPAAGFCSP
ncbi:hypothetical protein ACIO6T_44130, partial [Streptomyces sp. NPDC087532]